MKKIGKKILIGVIILSVVAGGTAVITAMRSNNALPVNYITINETELVNSISTKGIVESMSKRNVYPMVSGIIKNIYIEVGDKVTEGQILCELDTEDLKLNIAQQRADLNATEESNLNQLINNERIYQEALSNLSSGTNNQILNAESSFKTAEENLKTAQKKYDDTLKEINDGTNAQLTSALSGLTSAKLDLENAQKNYDDALKDQQEGTTSQVTTAESNLTSAKLDLDTAKKNYNDALKDQQDKTNSQIITAESNLTSAKLDLDIKIKKHEDNTILFNSGVISKEEYTQSENALTSAQNKYNDAQASYDNAISSEKKTLDQLKTSLTNAENRYNDAVTGYDNAIKSEDKTLDQLKTSLTSAVNRYNDAITNYNNAVTSEEKSLEQAENSLKAAQITYNNAAASVNAASVGANQDLEKYKSNIDNSQITVNNDSKLIGILKLEKQLTDSTIKAPMSGTVTAVYAKEGANASGLMFVIEDTDNLKIVTKIKEYDIGKVKEGMSVIIKSDSTGEATFDGTIGKIEPTAVKNTIGETDSSSDIEFAAEVQVAVGTDLKIGNNTRLKIVLEKKEGVFCVPYDAITTDEDGQKIIYVIMDGEKNLYLKKIAVTTGMETDFYVEVSNSELSQDVRVVNDASKVIDGMAVSLK